MLSVLNAEWHVCWVLLIGSSCWVSLCWVSLCWISKSQIIAKSYRLCRLCKLTLRRPHNRTTGTVKSCLQTRQIFYSCMNNWQLYKSGNSNYRERLSTVHLLVQTSLDQLLYVSKIVFTSFRKQAYLIRRSAVLSYPP
jgi:hypothetical protein